MGIIMSQKLNYKRWLNDNKSFLSQFSGKKLFILFSGGKDCTLILDYLLEAQREFKFSFEVHAGRYPVHIFTDDEIKKLDSYWKGRQVKIHWHKIADNDDEFDVAISKGINPCTVCHTKKREYMSNFILSKYDKLDNLVIVVSFTLWDIVSYSLENLLFNIFSNNQDKDTNYFGSSNTIQDRYFQTSQRFYPYIQIKDAFSIYRPFIRYNEQEVAEAMKEKNIPLSTTKCLYKSSRPKRILSECYEKMNLSFDYDRVVSFSKKALELHDISAYNDVEIKQYLADIF
jgi:tRNA(Ile)-lysidine synthase TilS/MesJ